jgi:hypothetical protein
MMVDANLAPIDRLRHADNEPQGIGDRADQAAIPRADRLS